MRSALLCVLYAIVVKEVSLATDEDFRPTPIPLNEWNNSTRSATGAGTLQEIIATDAPPQTAAVPAHYWEDALRHSVYLTLVRDKIDQLIAKGSIPDRSEHKDDDHDLWDKIKTAPFDRLNTEEPAILGDITIMSKGRLLDEENGLRFTEDEMSKEKCNEEKCNEGVKAYWSVKRVRQRDAETVPGKYHYELTFSVSSQTPKKQRKPYENPVRTFTVREGTPVEKPQYRVREPQSHMARPQRAIWFHKNIVPTPPRHVKQEQGLDRLFSSWFTDDEPPKRYKQVSYVPQRSKVGHVGAPTEQYHQQHGPPPYPYKPQPQSIPPNSYKYSRPPLAPVGPPIGPPPVSHPHTHHHYVDLDAIRHPNQHTSPPPLEIKYLSSNIVKTTKPAVLPTPPITYEPLNITMDLTQSLNVTETTTTKGPEIITAFTMYSKPRPPPTKMSYFPEHVRPPVFNAPPGVFVTMDKKPFKPMPPLKYMHSHKHNKNKPVDFRPSPQVLDVQFSDPDPMSDSFRPIAMSYGSNSTESSEHFEAKPHGTRKPTRKSKPPKKHDIKTHRTTTSAPEIITAHSEVFDDMDWANYLGAFAKTTPMVLQKLNVTEMSTPLPSTTVSSTTNEQSTPITTEATTTVSQKPRRTRPPPKVDTKPEKIKKHKRVTTTTTTSTTTTTEKPHHRRPSQDLTPQASSASTGATKSGWQSTTKTQNATVSTTPMSSNVSNVSITTTPEPSTTSNIVATTYRAATTTRQKTTSTTTEAITTTTEITATVPTIALKNNRFRQSTLMIKGTSVKHDKWSSPPSMEKNKTTTEKLKPLHGKFSRRKGSNFQGYNSTPKIVDEERHREDHIDHVYNPKLNVISLSTETTTEAIVSTTPITTQATTEELEEDNEQIDTEIEEFDNEDIAEEPDTNAGAVQESKDNNEFIFNTTKKSENFSPSDESNEVEPEIDTITEETIVTSPHSVAKNKTKCKKKKNNQSPQARETDMSDSEMSVAPIETTTEKLSTADFFNQIFGFTVDQNETDGNQTDSKYVDSDDDLEEFLHSINEKKNSNDTNETIEENDYDDDDKEEAENSPFNNDEYNRFARNADSSEEDYQDRPYSFLELMAME